MGTTIEVYNGTPTVMRNGKPIFYGCMWGSPPGADEYGERDIARSYGEAGVHIYAFDVGSPYEWRLADDGKRVEFDLSDLRGRFGRVIDVDRDAQFHLRIHLETPEWWNRAFPTECEVDSRGRRLCQSYASPLWRSQAKEFLTAYVAAIVSAGLEDRVLAYQTGAGGTGEWVKGDASMAGPCGDFSEPMARYFRSWLVERYAGDLDAFRRSWTDPSISFERAAVPPEERQHASTETSFRDPRTEMQVIDYYRALADLCADLIIDFNTTVKAASRVEVLTGAFYGYLAELAWNQSFFGAGNESEYSTTQRSGHLGLKKVLDSPAVDFIVSPYSYGFRGVGGEGAPMPPTESIRRGGKLYIYEEDSRAMTAADEDHGRVYTLADSVSVLKRNLAQVVTRGMGVWWLGTHQNPVGQQAFGPLLKRFMEIGEFALRLDRTPRSQIAVLLDDESFYYEGNTNALDLPLIFQQRLWGLPRLGAPYDMYLLDDFLVDTPSTYRLCIFLNAFAVDSERRDRIHRSLATLGATALWIYAPGYIGATGPSIDSMRALTGFAFGKGERPWGPLAHILDYSHHVTRELSADLSWGTNSILGPLFHVEPDDATTVLGQVVYSQGRCKPGLCIRDMDGWRSIYSAAPNLPAALLRGIAAHAGVHIYSGEGDVLYACGGLVGIHSVKGGARCLRLPAQAEVVLDLFDERELGTQTDRIETVIEPGGTQLFYAGTRLPSEGALTRQKGTDPTEAQARTSRR